MVVRFQPLDAWAARPPTTVVHIKGFASGLDFSDAATARCADALVACVRRAREAAAAGAGFAVAWDGDAFDAAGFTAVVARAATAAGAALVAFRYAAEARALAGDRFWSGRDVDCYLVDDATPPVGGCRSAALGLAGLAATGAADVLCLGGGAVVAREAAAAPAAFVVFPATRVDGGEASALAGAVNVSVETGAPLVLGQRDAAVAPSRLANAGDGLFARRPFAVGEVLADYGGAVLDTHTALRLGDKAYLMRLGEGVYVDARERPDVVARYVNDCRDARCTNVAFDKRPGLERAFAVVTRPVAAGDEFYASYGQLYWLGADMRGEPSSRLDVALVASLLAKERAFWDAPPPPP